MINRILFIIDCIFNESIQFEIIVGPSPAVHKVGGRGVLSLGFLLCLSVSVMFLGPLIHHVLGPLNKTANYRQILKFSGFYGSKLTTLQSMGIYWYKLVYMAIHSYV